MPGEGGSELEGKLGASPHQMAQKLEAGFSLLTTSRETGKARAN